MTSHPPSECEPTKVVRRIEPPRFPSAPSAFKPLVRSGPGPLALATLGSAALLSSLAPRDRLTWTLEVLVLGAAYAALALSSHLGPRLRPTASFLWVMWVYAFVMLIGAHWTYGYAPPGEWLRELFGLRRNPWDRVGHLFQGAVPALFVLGLLTEATRPLKRLANALLAGLATALVFEALEALVSVLSKGGDFVQAQGDAHDMFWDVLFAVIGASLAAFKTAGNKSTPRHIKSE